MYEPEIVLSGLFGDIEIVGISKNAIAVLADVPAATISRAASGQRDLSYQEYTRLRFCVDDLIALQNRFAPAKLDWSDVRRTRMLLDDFRKERVTPLSPLSVEDANLLHRFATGADIDHIAIDARMSKDELLQKIEGLLSRSSRLAVAAR